MFLVLVLQLACVTGYPARGGGRGEGLEVANLRRAATLPWTDGGRCAVQEASAPWAVLAERCFHALDHERIRFRDTTGRCAVASAGAAAVGIGLCVLAAPEVVVGAVVVTGVVVVGVVLKEALDAYEKRGRPRVRPIPAPPPLPEAKSASREPQKKQRPKPEPAGQDWPPLPPAPLDRDRRHKCEALPVPHRGGDAAHNACADGFPPNRYPGMDVLVDGKRFDALQVGAHVLWEIKTDQFDTYSDFLQAQVVEDQLEEFEEERGLARACGYGFKVGVSSEAHKAALQRADPSFDIVVTGCKR
ncbi:DUF6310 domain-containing protein [Melittangium boletus]|uniref:DUF6310 domain-containing protein n=1 Tax=Melittangium boletus TaxID=83453 RepID=UPI003DA5FB67